MGAAINGSTIGLYLVFPPSVLVKNPTPPESSGVSCARPDRPVEKIISAMAMSTTDRDARTRNLNLRCGIAVTLAPGIWKCVPQSSVLCQLVVTLIGDPKMPAYIARNSEEDALGNSVIAPGNSSRNIDQQSSDNRLTAT
jgi:hypothetical protein